jgi:hypothetical protein
MSIKQTMQQPTPNGNPKNFMTQGTSPTKADVAIGKQM